MKGKILFGLAILIGVLAIGTSVHAAQFQGRILNMGATNLGAASYLFTERRRSY